MWESLPCLKTEAYGKGAYQKKCGNDEPDNPYLPGGIKYKEFVYGYLKTAWPPYKLRGLSA